MTIEPGEKFRGPNPDCSQGPTDVVFRSDKPVEWEWKPGVDEQGYPVMRLLVRCVEDSESGGEDGG